MPQKGEPAMLSPDCVKRFAVGGKVLTINEKIIPDSARAAKDIASWCKRGQPMKPCRKMPVKGVTIHNTGDLANVEDDAEQYTRATLNGNMGGVVVHYYVDDAAIWQNLREDEQGWHAADGFGPGNTTTIAIECIMSGRGDAANRAAEENAARLAAYLLKKYSLGIDRLYTHNHWMGQPDRIVPGVRKNCPIYILPHWESFKARVAELMGGSRTPYLVRLKDAQILDATGKGAGAKISGVYTITEEKDGRGRLKSGAGWIDLSRAERM